MNVERLPRHARGQKPVEHRHHRLSARAGVGIGSHHRFLPSDTLFHVRSLACNTNKIGRIALGAWAGAKS